MLRLMHHGSKNRVIASTRINSDSSRSYALFIITVTWNNVITETKKIGKVFLVDFAGSKMVNKTHAQRQTLEEAKIINKSLLALGNVIKAFVEQNFYIPYRDSKLTRVLQVKKDFKQINTNILFNCKVCNKNKN